MTLRAYDMRVTTAGGAATNAGIDFQHRVGAVAMLTMLTDLSGLDWLVRGTHDVSVNELRFETSDGVDDLVIATDGPLVLVQAKRSPSLSEATDSDFSSTLRQFVEQFVRGSEDEEMYVLATSPSASSRIRIDLQELTEAARLNELAPEANPLAKSKERVLNITYDLIGLHFEQLAERPITDDERREILRRIHVANVDLEPGGSLERAVLTVLASRTAVAPMLIWGNLVSLGLSLAKRRASIDKAALAKRFGEYFVEQDVQAPAEADDEVVRIAMADQLPAGKEVVLMSLGERSLLAELFRFSDDGSRRFEFGRGEFEVTEGIQGKLIRRSATMAGMQRMVLADPSLVEGKDLLLAPLQSDEDPESSSWAQAHAELLTQLVRANPAPLECLQCGRPMSEQSAPVVEVDEEGTPHQVGLVHSACLQPTQRVLGTVSGGALQSDPLLKDFDYEAWFSNLPSGQGTFRELGDALRTRLPALGWKPGRQHQAVGTWGVTYQLEDGSERYVSERGRVLRVTEEEAKEQARLFNEQFERAAAKNDPWCANDKGFGPYSVLLQADPSAQPLHVERGSAEARQLTRAVLVAHDAVENWYAPLVVLLNAETRAPFMINGARVLLTDPLRLRESVENWSAAGLDVSPLTTSVLRTDGEFDSFVSQAFRDGVGVVIDPVLDGHAVPISALMVRDIESALEGTPGQRVG